jgi:hypothetical protein
MIFLKFFFSRMSLQKQAEYLRKNGIMLGTRVKDGRKVYVYMLRDLFVEVVFKGDELENEAETLNMVRGLDNLNDYLEREFRATF